jgi:hypothetical protein
MNCLNCPARTSCKKKDCETNQCAIYRPKRFPLMDNEDYGED